MCISACSPLPPMLESYPDSVIWTEASPLNQENFMNKRVITLRNIFLALVGLVFAGPPAIAESAFGYELETDVIYGKGRVIQDGVEVDRSLMLDIYAPINSAKPTVRPAVILVHGGAYHRGGRRQPPFREDGAVHSRMEDYARMLAPLGYVCFVIEYRLAPELPQPENGPDGPNLLDVDDVVTPAGLARTNFARRAMGLVELGPDEKIIIWNAAMAAAEDLDKAVKFLVANAVIYNIDPEKIALGGHSAGGGSVLNAAFGLKSPVAAIFPLSPPDMIFDKSKVISRESMPPTLIVISQNDDPVVLEPLPGTIDQLVASGLEYQFAWVPGFPHFYPSGAVSLADDGTRMSVGERITGFLDTYLKD